MSMSKRGSEFALIATGVGLYWLGTKTFADYHDNVATGIHDDFQHRHSGAIATTLSLVGLGLGVYGTYQVNRTWGKALGLGLGGLIGWNFLQHQRGAPMISLAPLSLPKFFRA